MEKARIVLISIILLALGVICHGEPGYRTSEVENGMSSTIIYITKNLNYFDGIRGIFSK